MKYGMITTEVMDKMCACFSSVQEVMDFCDTIEEVGRELVFLARLRERLPDMANAGMRMKEIAMLVMFFRDNIEILRQLVNVCEIKPVSDEEVEKMSEKTNQKLAELDKEFNLDWDKEFPE
jgi:hypothetical protein